METYLLIWNSTKTPRSEKDYWQKLTKNIRDNGYIDDSWSTGRTKRIKPNDRLFLVRLGEEPRGIFASGWATSNVYQVPHWDEQKYANGKITGEVRIRYDAVADPDMDPILTIAKLKANVSNLQEWQPQGSANGIDSDKALRLEKEWFKLTGYKALSPAAELLPDEIDSTETFAEGAPQKIFVNKYERDPKLRTICIKHYGLECWVCKCNFEEKYGHIGHGYIHIHHLKPLSLIKRSYKVNPIKDLCPVCPNCHAMLHMKRPKPYTPEQLKKMISG